MNFYAFLVNDWYDIFFFSYNGVCHICFTHVAFATFLSQRLSHLPLKAHVSGFYRLITLIHTKNQPSQ